MEEQTVCKSCECGCGAEVTKGKRFIHGHHVRVRNPMHTQAAKDKISTFWTGRKRPEQVGDKNVSKRQSVRRKLSENNAMHSERHRASQKAGCLTDVEVARRSKLMREHNPSQDEGVLERRTATYAKRLANGEYHIRSNRWKSGWYTRANGDKEWYDSSYELAQMQEYDAQGVVWTKKHGIRIPYVDEKGRKTFYVPDFLVVDDTGKTLVEVKGWMRKSVVVKAKVAIEYCKTMSIHYLLLLGQERTIVENLSFTG